VKVESLFQLVLDYSLAIKVENYDNYSIFSLIY
jgi:hypothetical protein